MINRWKVLVSPLLAAVLLMAGFVIWITRENAPYYSSGSPRQRTLATNGYMRESAMRRVPVERSPNGEERGAKPLDNTEAAFPDSAPAGEPSDDAESPWADARAHLIQAVDDVGIWCDDGESVPYLLPPSEHDRALHSLRSVLKHYAGKAASFPERVAAVSRELDMQEASQERRAGRMATLAHDGTCMSSFFESAEFIADSIRKGNHRVAARRRQRGTYSERADVNSSALVFAGETLTVKFYKGEWSFAFALDESVFADGLWEEMSLARARVLETVK